MTETDFWNLIEKTRAETDGNIEGQLLEMEDLLQETDEATLLSFTHHLQNKLGESYNAILWGASYLINCTDDEQVFEAFRAWLILQGKKAFDDALMNADTLVDLINEDEIDDDYRLQAEGLLLLPFSVYEEMTGNDPSEMPIEPQEFELKGVVWEKEEELIEELPLLFDLLGWDVEESSENHQE